MACSGNFWHHVSWAAVHTTILDAARDTFPTVVKPKRAWLSTETLAIIHKNSDARLRGSLDEWRRYKGIFRATSKADLEDYYGRLADEAEEGVRQQPPLCVPNDSPDWEETHMP